MPRPHAMPNRTPFSPPQTASPPLRAALGLVVAVVSFTALNLDARQDPAVPIPGQESSASEAAPLIVDSRDPLELQRLADDAFARDDLAAATALYRRSAEYTDDPAERGRILLTVAWLEDERGLPDRATETLVEALWAAPDLEIDPAVYGDALLPRFYDAQQLIVERRETQAEEAIRQGLEALRAGRHGEARERLAAALAQRPDHPKALYNLALVHLYDDRLDDAIEGFQKLQSLAASQPQAIDPQLRSLALANVGAIFLRQGANVEARDALDDAVAIDPGNQAAWSNLGVARRRLGDGDAAEAFRRAHDLAPQDAGAINNLALAYLDAKDWVQAVALLRQATERFTDNASLWLNLALAQQGLGNDEGAVVSFERSIAADPQDAGGWASTAALHLARHYDTVGNSRGALAAARRAADWRPEQTNAWIYQGLALQALGDLELAAEALERGRGLDPTRVDVHINLGSVYFELGRLDEAERALRRALDIDPESTTAQANLASVMRAQETGVLPRRRPRVAETAPPAPPPPASRQAGSQRPPGGSTASSTPSTRASLGVRVSAVDYGALGLRGLLVDEVVPDSAAARAGLRADDLLLRAAGQQIETRDDLASIAAARRPGDALEIELLRANRPVRVQLILP
ncbi:MAG: tetratricopeptide repeat protein [Acidobacteriota bacterium]